MTDNYEVHTWTLCGGWINCWRVTDEKGGEQPDTYSTIEAAQAEIDDLFEDSKNEITSGERSPDDDYNREDYRIYDRGNNEYVG
jgi:hypothetical protein